MEHTAKAGSAVIVTCVSLLLLAFCVSPALASHRGRVFGSSFGSPGSGAGQLSLAHFFETGFIVGGSGIAVDDVSHNVYVVDTGNHRVDDFTSAGAFVRAWGWGVVNGASEFQICTQATGCRAGLAGDGPGQFENSAYVAVDDTPGGSGDVYIADYDGQGGERVGVPLVQKFTAEGALVESWGSKGQLTETSVPSGLGIISGVAVTPAGQLLVGTGGGIFEFDGSSGAYVTKLGNGTTEWPNGLAIDGSGNFYYQALQQIGKYSPAGAKVGEVFELPNPPLAGAAFAATGLAVTPSGELYLDEGNAIEVIAPSCDSSCVPATTFSSPLLTDGAGLAVDSKRETLYIAEVATDKIESIIPEPPAAPLVEADSQRVTDVSGDSARLEAVIDPRSEPGEEATTYRFQYATEESFQREGFAGSSSIPVPDGQLAPSYEADLVTARPKGLVPDTVYHYRVVAENSISRKEGKPTEGERDEAGEEVGHAFTTQALGVFALPDDRAWELVSPADKHGALFEPITGQVMIQAAESGDALTYVATAPTESEPEGNSNLTQVLSTRSVAGAWGSRDLTTPREVANGLTFGSQEYQEYRFFSADLSLAIVNPSGVFDPSLSSEASEQTAFLRTNYPSVAPSDPCSNSCYRPLVTGAERFANVPEGTKFGAGQGGRVEGPTFVGATPDASHIVLFITSSPLTEGAPNEGLYEWAAGQLQLVSVLPNGEPAQDGGSLGNGGRGAGTGNGRNAISTDGSRVVWSTGGKSSALYLRDTVREETVQVGGVDAEYQAASSDATHVFFTVAGDLYVFDAPAGEALSAGHVTNLTPAGGVLGVPGASGDGSSVYFVSRSALTGSETNQHGEASIAGQPNLYVAGGSEIKLVAVLSNEDSNDWAPQVNGLTSRVSPNGRWLGFMSERSLTGYDNRDASSGERDEEVFLYDATANGGRGGLVCASCDPTGARPHGMFDEASSSHLLVDNEFRWFHRWLAANVPGWTSPVYQSRYLSNTGRLFFNSSDALVASDTNGTEDVYEYEPAGVGGCTSVNTTFSASTGGCVDLISSGVSKEESEFLDASESGDDVFFLTTAQLSKEDTDVVPDVYDARVDGGLPEPQAPPACEGDACQSPVAAPNDPTPGSLTYRGPGNPAPLLTVSHATKKKALKCTKGKKFSHGKCVKIKKKAKRAGHVTATRRDGNNRGAKS